ncbi:MAG: hypothetical protein J6W42_07380 [Bacteroidaceae bacterium]|nr:hypothetical protein [Bacteroidaceae bacterium]
MKKSLAISVLLLAAFASVFAQETIKKGDLIYGTVSNSEGPFAGIVITERNFCDRIMSQTTADVNGQFSFRVVNPNNRILISYVGYETMDLPINRRSFEIKMKKQAPLQPIELIDGPVPPVVLEEMIARIGELGIESYELSSFRPNEFKWELINTEIGRMHSITEYNSIPGKGLYIPSADHATYYSIDDFYNNWLLPIKSMY